MQFTAQALALLHIAREYRNINEQRNMKQSAMSQQFFHTTLAWICFTTCNLTYGQTPPPAPYGPIPSERQLRWHGIEFYCFTSFTINTFTDKEWGYGDEDPSLFAPTAFDANQIVEVAKAAGMKGLILTCKHHDGFCLWPSKYTEHSVKNIPWKDGNGDVVYEIAKACADHGIEFGIYLSPWDRNHPHYGNREYIEYYRKQLEELLTNYGPIFEVWIDGANGGDGYYGGSRERRKIDRSSYYDWGGTFDLVRKLQPSATILSDAGPDARWVGNESGIAGDPCWATFTPHPAHGETVPGPGATLHQESAEGHRDGRYWMPAEADVSIRPGWFYHPSENQKVRSAENLLDLYFASIGRGAALILNVPPDRRGQIHEIDQASLVKFRRLLDETFKKNLLRESHLTPSNERDSLFGASKAIDGDRTTYWATDDNVTEASLEVEFPEAVSFNVVDLREHLALGQRVHQWRIDRWDVDGWVKIAGGESIGSRRLWRGANVETRKIRFRVSGPVCPAISEFGVYLCPLENR